MSVLVLGRHVPGSLFTVNPTMLKMSKSDFITDGMPTQLHHMLPKHANTTLEQLHHLDRGAKAGDFDAAVKGKKRILTIVKALQTNIVFGGYFEDTFGTEGVPVICCQIC